MREAELAAAHVDEVAHEEEVAAQRAEERRVELVVAAADAEAAYPAADRVVAANELAALTAMNRQLAQ
jgi:hypothetical protein